MRSELTGETESRPTPTGELGARPRPEWPGTTATRTEPREATTRRPDMSEFLGAFAVGAVIGATTVLLMRPEPKHGAARIRKDLAPYGKRVRERTLIARRNFAAGADAASAAVEALGQAGRILVQDLREEVAEVVRDARSDLSAAVNEQFGQARKLLRRSSRRAGRR